MSLTDQPPTWVIMPVLACPEYTEAAIADCTTQSVPTRLLVVNQGVADPFRQRLEQIAEQYATQVFLWHHQPPLPSLAGTWNRALDFVWSTGGTEALVVNNDVRLHWQTISMLRSVLRATHGLFVSCVGVTADQFDLSLTPDAIARALGIVMLEDSTGAMTLDWSGLQKGGPDFSCFLISRECHDCFRFDEHFTPAYCEDLDFHRRLLLAGEGARIFSVNLPFLHHGAGTLKAVDAPEHARIEAAISAGSRTYYQKKWGGPVNQETFLAPFGGGWSEPAKVDDGTATTPYLQAHPPTAPLEGFYGQET
jgi:hypothetical protein